MTYGDASVWVYDTGAGLISGNYMGLTLQNSVLSTGAYIGTADYGPQFGVTGGNYLCGFFDGSGTGSGVLRTQAWHLLDIDDTAQSLTMSVDGSVVYSGPGGTPFDSLQLYLNDWSGRPGFTTYYSDFSFSGSPAPTPEPSTFALLGVGAISLAAYGWRRKRQRA